MGQAALLHVVNYAIYGNMASKAHLAKEEKVGRVTLLPVASVVCPFAIHSLARGSCVVPS